MHHYASREGLGGKLLGHGDCGRVCRHQQAGGMFTAGSLSRTGMYSGLIADRAEHGEAGDKSAPFLSTTNVHHDYPNLSRGDDDAC